MEIKIRFTMYFRKQITSVLMCCSRLLSLSHFLLHIKRRSCGQKRSLPCSRGSPTAGEDRRAARVVQVMDPKEGRWEIS